MKAKGDLKVCSKCRQELPLSMFYAQEKGSDGLQSHCIACSSKQFRAYRLKMKESYEDRLKRLSLRCPGCDEANMKKWRNQERWRCKTCGDESTMEQLLRHLETRKTKPKPKREVSGTKAGPIVIGRGSFWHVKGPW